MKIITYLKENLTMEGESFIKVWGTLSASEKEDLKKYAREEMAVRNIVVEE